MVSYSRRMERSADSKAWLGLEKARETCRQSHKAVTETAARGAGAVPGLVELEAQCGVLVAGAGTRGPAQQGPSGRGETWIFLKSGSRHDRHYWRGQEQRSDKRRLVCKLQVCADTKQAAAESGEQEPI